MKLYNWIRNKWDIILVEVIVFVGMLYFFYVSHPIYIYDTDDWTYIGYVRSLYPTIKEWNPTKILPETLLPLICKIGVVFIKPLLGNYFESLSFTFAISYSLIITIYITFIMIIHRNTMQIRKNVAICLSLIVILLHFYLFKNGSYLFFEYTINNVFNYTIPTLINAILVMVFILCRGSMHKFTAIRKGIIILLIYLCINSNMYSNVILMSYIGAELIFDLGGRLVKKQKLISIIRERALEFIICILWIGSAFIEVNGNRAKGNTSISLISNLGTTINVFINSLKYFRYGIYFVFLFCAIIYITLIRSLNKNNEQAAKTLQSLSKCITMCLLSLMYLIILSSKVNPNYMSRASVVFAWMYGLILGFVFCIGYVVSNYSISEILLPVLLYMLVLKTSIQSSYLNIGQYDPEKNKTVSEFILDQIVEADNEGYSEVEVLVPKYESSDNFPIALYGGDRIANTLFNHGITQRCMKITLIPDEKVNGMFNIK